MKDNNKNEMKLDFDKAKEELKESFTRRMLHSLGTYLPKSSKREKFVALSYAIRDKLITKWHDTQGLYYDNNPKRVYYLSMEFLMGRTLGNALINLDFDGIAQEAMKELGISLEELEDLEWDAGLGNGGLGRLAACFLDSMATLGLPAYGYGIRYEFGMFEQKIVGNKQHEIPDTWLRHGYPFELEKFETNYVIHFGGHVQQFPDSSGNLQSRWIDCDQVMAKAYDTPIPGYQTNTVNTLRLWSARATREFNLKHFDNGDFVGALNQKNLSETISKVLYPNDNTWQGKKLRLTQQYFMVSASIQDILKRFLNCKDKIENLHNKIVIQLNDTHPTLGIPELMRILLDHYHMSWDQAFNITKNCFAYTNHTILPEAIEKWSVHLFEEMLPRHLQIIYEINSRFLDQVSKKFPGDFDRYSRMSIIDERDGKKVNMAHLAMVGSFSINGVAQLHSDLLKSTIFKDYYEMYPEKFNNKTNGVTPRRWIKKANPQMSDLITSKIGPLWIKDLSQIKKLETYARNEEFGQQWAQIKRNNKENLAKLILQKCHIEVNPDSLFDVQVKRIHEYKRQLLNVLHCIHLYHQIKDNPHKDFVPRTVIFGGKAAPGYFMAKLIINLINNVADVINNDPKIKGLLKLVFIPNYGVTLAQTIIPGTDLSEQISTAGYEASGTGNMKFAMNGALTIATLDGANVEMKEVLGDDNIIIFGNTVEDLEKIKSQGYNPRDYYENDIELKRILDDLSKGYFSPHERGLFQPIIDELLNHGDRYFHLADFRYYISAQHKVSELYQNQKIWREKSILNCCRMSKFSSDRTILEYAQEIWKVEPCQLIKHDDHGHKLGLCSNY